MIFHTWAEQSHMFMKLGMLPVAAAATSSYLNIGAGHMFIHLLDYSSLKGRGANWVFTRYLYTFLYKNVSHLYLTGARIGRHGAEAGGIEDHPFQEALKLSHSPLGFVLGWVVSFHFF